MRTGPSVCDIIHEKLEWSQFSHYFLWYIQVLNVYWETHTLAEASDWPVYFSIQVYWILTSWSLCLVTQSGYSIQSIAVLFLSLVSEVAFHMLSSKLSELCAVLVLPVASGVVVYHAAEALPLHRDPEPHAWAAGQQWPRSGWGTTDPVFCYPPLFSPTSSSSIMNKL